MNACIINVWGYTEILPKQGFEGKKLSRKEFVAFEEYRRVCVVDMGRLGDSYCFLTWNFAFILLVILQNPLK